MKILSIGNSFSQDAQHYLHALAKHNGVNLRTINLYIGGCSLQRHYWNMLDDRADYSYEFNSETTGLKVSIREALTSDLWDYVTVQQASPVSPKSPSYFPYIEALADYIRKYQPKTKILVHQTWAYEDGTERLQNVGGFETAEAMMAAIRDSYKTAADAIDAHGIIPCGEAMLRAAKAGLQVHRDSAHAGRGAGRYLLSLTWLKTLTGIDISNDTFSAFDVPVSDEERRIVIEAVNDATK